MRSTKRATYATASLSIITFLICFFLRFEKPFIYDISLACFGSALLGFVVAYTGYSAERRDAMEQFWHAGMELMNQIRGIKHFEIDKPADLVREAISEETGYYIVTKNTHEAKKKLKNWIEENQYPDDGKDDYTETLEKYYQGLIDGYEKSMLCCAQSYINFSEANIRALSNAYGKLDFLCANKSIRLSAYNDIYRKIYDFHVICREEVHHLELATKGNAHLGICFEKIIVLDKMLFKQEDDMVFAFFADDLDRNLETFRSKIYGKEPEYSDPIPIQWMIGFEQIDKKEKTMKHEEDILDKTTRIRQACCRNVKEKKDNRYGMAGV